MEQLATTSVMLGIIAAVSVLEALVIIGVGICGFLAYRKAMETMADLEKRYVVPAINRVDAILDDVQSVAATVKAETDRVDRALHGAIDRVDDTVDRVRWNVRNKTSRLIGLVRGARVAIETVLGARAA